MDLYPLWRYQSKAGGEQGDSDQRPLRNLSRWARGGAGPPAGPVEGEAGAV